MNQEDESLLAPDFPASSQLGNKNVYLMSTPEMQKQHDASTLWFNSTKWSLRDASVSPGTWNWEEFLLLLRHLIQICSSASHTSLQMPRGAGGLNAWQSVQLPSSHCTAPPQWLLLEKYTSNFGFVISNRSNPLNGFPGYQSACQKDRGKENVRRNTRKSPSLKIK